jgi:hypothetical protein
MNASRRSFIKTGCLAFGATLLASSPAWLGARRRCVRCETSPEGISSTGFCRVCGAWAESGEFRLPSHPISLKINKKQKTGWSVQDVPFPAFYVAAMRKPNLTLERVRFGRAVRRAVPSNYQRI